MVTYSKFPFSKPSLRDEPKHTLWLLERVDSAKALAFKLKKHPIFNEYEIVLAAGDGRLSEEDERKNSYVKVRKAIDEHEKTITLSVGQLTTGITIPEWTGVMMLSNLKSPSLYMQAAFRAQNPWQYRKDGQHYRKEQAYVFDFDPVRTLSMYEEFANGLSTETADSKGTLYKHKDNIRQLLNFFPVIGEDSDGTMKKLDPDQVLSIPRKLKAQEVVNRGFMSNFLFQNLTNVFHAPKAVLDILNRFEPIKEKDLKLSIEESEDLDLDEDGNIDIPDESIQKTASNIFGSKIYEVSESLKETIEKTPTPQKPDDKQKKLEHIKKQFQIEAINPLIETAKQEYGKDLTPGQIKKLDRRLKGEADLSIERIHTNHDIETSLIEREREKELQKATDQAQVNKINEIFDIKIEEAGKAFKEQLNSESEIFVEKASKEIVKTVETAKQEKKSESMQDTIKKRLRGFTRTIPAFLMAYGTDENHAERTVNLRNFDQLIPGDVFKDVTNTSLEDFRVLRDGGHLKNETTGNMDYFEGHLFDETVFDQSVLEFMTKKEKLSNYMLENSKGDIFDYIPPQKNNQIFTPKKIVIQMVDDLEKESPGIFDNPNKTFIDLYMKSGLYPAEIVKRLYRSKKMKELFPDDKQRLKHIFENRYMV